MKHSIIKISVLSIILLTTSIEYGQKKNIDYVNPFIGTGGHGHTFPGATAPFGMVQLSPDTRMEGWDGCGGYHYDDTYVYGFAHTHLSGTGCSDLSDILLMPFTGNPALNYKNGKPAFGSKFSHKNESASAGYYKVFLDDYGIQAQLSATTRAGFHVYQYPKDAKETGVIIDLSYRDAVYETKITKVSDKEVEGYRISHGWSIKEYVYFVARFSKPIISINTVKEEKADITSLIFDNSRDNTLKVKVGISQVDIEGARKNLDKEIPGWDFEKTVKETKSAWSKFLNRLNVSGGTEDEKTIFYTSIYHSMVTPNICQDVDGRYRALDLKIYNTGGRNQFTTFSLWDTYRAAHPLYTIAAPEMVDGMIKTMLDDFKKGGNLPVWTLFANDTWCMIGNHSIPVIVDAYIKKLTDADPAELLNAMDVSVKKEREGYSKYDKAGLLLTDFTNASVSKTLEYAYDDWCIAQLAKLSGNKELYSHYMKRAQSYKNLFDETTGFFRAKNEYSWVASFDPYEVNSFYTEANAWQYRYYVPQDIEGWKNLLGGSAALEKILDDLFNAKTETTGHEQSDMTGFIGQYVHGNEPSHHMAYLYNYTPNPWKGIPVINKLCTEMYTNKPDGLAGNEDCGQMSAWFVLSAMGFYPVNPCGGVYELGTPLFKSINISLPGGKKFSISSNKNSSGLIYPTALKMNGKNYTKNYIHHSDLTKGGSFTFTLSAKPDEKYSASLTQPVSSIYDNVITVQPYLSPVTRRFAESVTVEIGCPDKKAVIYYTTDGSEPTKNSPVYSKPFTLSSSTHVKAFALSEKWNPSAVISASFEKISMMPSVKIDSPLSNGLNYSYYEGRWRVIPDFTTLTPAQSGVADKVDLSKKIRDEYFGLEFNGWINAPADGLYILEIGSDDGSILVIDDAETIDNDGMHSFGKKSKEMILAKGLHAIKVKFIQGGGDADLKLFWKGPGFDLKEVSSSELFRK